MKKHNLTKLILKGVATGALLASQTVVADTSTVDSTYLAFGKCGAHCNGQKSAAGTRDATNKIAQEDINTQIYTDEDEEQAKKRRNNAPAPQPSYRNSGRGGCGGIL
jgi:hypothetical protein